MTSVPLPQIPTEAAGRIRLPKLPRLRRTRDELFYVAAEILEASSDNRRAEILLRLPDAVLLEKMDAITHACRQAGFKIGMLFIGQRVAALSATRGRDGELPQHHVETLQLWRNGLAAMATKGDQ